jgi:hypothetical protein
MEWNGMNGMDGWMDECKEGEIECDKVWKEAAVAPTDVLKGLRNTTKTSATLSQCMGRDSNRALPEYNSEASSLEFTCSAESPH